MKLQELCKAVGVTLDDATVAKLEGHIRVRAKTVKVNQKFIAAGKDTKGVKMPLQMSQAISVLDAETPVDLKTWAEKLAKVEGFRTQQPVEKILAFYRKRILDEGFAKVAA